MKQMELSSFHSMHLVYHMKKKAFLPTATRYLGWYLFYDDWTSGQEGMERESSK
jgi:hypothetical protein